MKSRRRRRRSSCFVQRHRLSIPLLKGAERGGDEAGGEAAEALPDEDDERPGDAALCALPRDMGAERFDEGVEAGEQKTGGCGGWGGHGIENPMRGWGWARRFVSFAPALVCLAIQVCGWARRVGLPVFNATDRLPRALRRWHIRSAMRPLQMLSAASGDPDSGRTFR